MSQEADFDAFYAVTARRLVAAVYALTGDLAEAEDAVQEAYARAWQRWGRLAREGDPLPWVRTVASRPAISTWRRTRNRLRAQFRHGPAPDVPGLSADHVALVAALRGPSPDQRRVVVPTRPPSHRRTHQPARFPAPLRWTHPSQSRKAPSPPKGREEPRTGLVPQNPTTDPAHEATAGHTSLRGSPRP